LQSTITKDKSVTGQNIVGMLIADCIDAKDVLPYLKILERTAFDFETEYCTYNIKDRLFLAEFLYIEYDRIKIREWDITGMSLREAWDLPI